MENNYDILIRKLQQFIRKYYANRAIKGLLLSFGILIILLFSLGIIEYFGNFATATRTIFFYSFCIITFLTFFVLVFLPLLKLLHFGKQLSYEDAAKIIGKHFGEINDTLLNTLQLKSQASRNGNEALVIAAINQKIEKIKPVRFQKAIPLKRSLKYAKYAVIPIVLWIILSLISPKITQEPINRIIQHQTTFEQKKPFEFHIENSNLKGIKQEDFLLKVTTKGDVIPNEVWLTIENNRPIRLTKIAENNFEFRFTKVRKNIHFYLHSGIVSSLEFTLEVFPRPVILEYSTFLDFPAYTKKRDITTENSSSLIVPIGTKIDWDFFTRDAEVVMCHSKDSSFKIEKSASNKHSFSTKALKSFQFSITTENSFMLGKDSIFFNCEIIPDNYPIIAVDELKDSLFGDNIYFNGYIEDDYGFSKLLFVYTIGEEGESNKKYDTLAVPKNLLKSDFYYGINFKALGLKANEEISYYFELWDNDAINGAKSSKTQKMHHRSLSKKEREDEISESGKNLQSKMENSMQEAESLKKDVKELREKLLQKEKLEWEDKEAIQQLLQKQEELKSQMEMLKFDNHKKNNMESSFEKPNPELLEKQKELEKLFDELMTDEMKKLMEEIKKLVEEANKEKMQEALQNMDELLEDYEEQLDRNLELFRQLEFEKKLEEAIEDAKKLAEEQKKLSEKTEESKRKNLDEIKEEQQKLNEKFEELNEKLDQIEELDKSLEEPNGFEKPEEKMEEVSEEMQKSEESLQKQQKKKASESQKSAAKKMEEASKQLMAMQAQMQQEKQGESIENLRMILENLLIISFEQESIINSTGNTTRNNPQYKELGRRQHDLKNGMLMVADSLKALAKREATISRTVMKELGAIEKNMDKSLEKLSETRKGDPKMNQQYAMTSINNLALLLQEILEQMQQQMNSMSSSSSSSSSCDNPSSQGGGKKPKSSMPSMKEMQKQLSEQLEKMKGKNPKGEKPGGQSGQNGEPQQSEELARMAAQQMALRNKMQQYMDEMDGENGIGNLKKMIEEMEQNETDIINRNITEQTLQRQKEILTRMLKAEEAEKEREKEKRRESNEAKNQKFSNPPALFQYKENRKNKLELLRSVPPEFILYYRNKVNEYLYNVDN